MYRLARNYNVTTSIQPSKIFRKLGLKIHPDKPKYNEEHVKALSKAKDIIYENDVRAYNNDSLESNSWSRSYYPSYR